MLDSALVRTGLMLALAIVLGATAPTRGQDFATAWVWQAPAPGLGDAGLLTTNFDGDPRDEILLDLPHDYDPYYAQSGPGSWSEWGLGATIRQTWCSLPLPDGVQALRATPPPLDQIVVASGGSLLVFDGHDKSFVRSIATGASPAEDFELADLDGDLALEVVLCDRDNLYLYDFDAGTPLAVRYGFGCRDVEIGQTDADASAEIVLAGNPTGGIVLDGSTLVVEWVEIAGYGEQIVLADANADFEDDVILFRSDSTFDRVSALEPGTGLEIWGYDTYDAELFRTADVAGDPRPEILAWDGDVYGGIIALDALTGIPAWTIPTPDAYPYAVNVGDFDGDGATELAATTSLDYGDAGGLSIFDLQTQLPIAELDPLGRFLTDIDLGDIDADGDLELATIVAQNYYYDEWQRAVFDLVTRSISWMEPADYRDTDLISLRLGQIDGDPALELCATGGDYYFTRLECLDGTTHQVEWTQDLEEVQQSTAVRIFDLDGAGVEEVLVATEEPFVWAFEGASGWLRWRTPPIDPWAGPYFEMLFGDVTGDGAADLVAGAAGSSFDLPLALFDPATGGLVAGPFDVAITAMDLAQMDGDPELELVATVGSYSYADVVVIDPLTGIASPPLASFADAVRSLKVADMTDDGQPDFVVLVGSVIQVVDGTDASLVWESPDLGEDSSYGRDRIDLAELGGDARPEIVVNLGPGFAIFGDPVFAAFADGFESGDTSEWSVVEP